MKILGGRYKGLTIDISKNISYRPTQTRIRKSIFDILTPFTYSNVLDLYSGSGILGFEAVSRGAESITFVENNSASIKMLNRNLKRGGGDRRPPPLWRLEICINMRIYKLNIHKYT